MTGLVFGVVGGIGIIAEDWKDCGNWNET